MGFNVETLRSLVEGREEGPTSALRELVIFSLKIALSQLSQLLEDHLLVLLVLNPIAESSPGLVNPQLGKVEFTPQISLINLCNAIDNLENVSDIEMVQELVRSRLNVLLEEFVDLQGCLNSILHWLSLNA